MTVQRDLVVKQLVELEVHANEEGLIPAFNVLVNVLPTSFWNTFSERLVKAAPPDQVEEVENGLVECALECGYNTGFGIITSEEFKAAVEPMVSEGAKDILRGAYAVFTAWGWAKSGIVQIKEGERMVVRAVDYYESETDLPRLCAYMIRGVSSAFFDLAYGEQYPDGIHTFRCMQTQGMEVGDKFAEFVVTEDNGD